MRVMARSTPEDKFLLVGDLIEAGSTVAVTGDGTNDAPALMKADVGFAMGLVGTEVAKEAADIILLDDNFASVITAAKWGRNIFASVRKFLQFQLTVNVVAMFIAFLGGVVLGESPLTSVQMLWVNLIMDTFAALALATEPPDLELLKDKPYSKKDSIMTTVMWRNIIGQAAYQIVFLGLLLFFGPLLFDLPRKAATEPWTPENGVLYTMVFNTFVFMQCFNEVNARKIKAHEFNVFAGFFNNPLFIFIELVTVAVQVLLVSVGGRAFKCSPLTWGQHLICVGIGVLSLAVALLVKVLPKRVFAGIKVQEQQMAEHEARSSVTGKLRKLPRSLTNSLSRTDGEKLIIKRLSEKILLSKEKKQKVN